MFSSHTQVALLLLTVVFRFISSTSLDSQDPVSSVTKDYEMAFLHRQQLSTLHALEWQKLWDSRIEFQGNLSLAQVLRLSRYNVHCGVLCSEKRLLQTFSGGE
jgi:hypothetical protein